MSNSLASVHPELISEWSEKNLPLTPDKITFGSNKRVWWKGACGHEWETSVKARSKGEKCPICSGARVIEGINDLATLKPQLAQEWSEKNELKPTEVSVASHKKIIWKCKHGHEWEASVKSRTVNGTGCPYCSHNKVLAGFNDLASQYPDIATEWSDRNLPLLPTMVTAFANSKAWWKCKDCGNEWHTLISTRSGGSRCPYCSGYTLLKGFNDLATTHPDLAAEWSERNYPLMPDEVNAKSRRNVWWKCKTCGNEWKSVINARVKGTVCPVCADRAVLAGYNDLATTDRKLLAEWDYEKNSLLPAQVSRRSMKSVWWKCSLGHSWKAKISDRTIIGEKCTVCENEYRSVFPGLAVAYYHTHSYGSVWKSDADKHWHECSCGDKSAEAVHTAGDWITDTPATAATAGTKHKECTACGYVMETGTIPATGYTVSFDANGGTGTMADVTGVLGDYTLPANGFTAPEGKRFKAWSVNGTEKAVGDKITVSADTTVKAVWEAVKYNITVTNGTASVSKAAAGTTVTLNANAAPDGQVFDKWVVESGSITLADASNATTTFTMPAGDVSVKATYHTHSYGSEWKSDADKHWHECSCGDKSAEAVHTAGDWIIDTPATATTAGTKHKECTTCGYVMETGTIPATGYTVSFDANGGTGTMADVTGVSGTYTLPENGFTAPEGMQFKAWSVGGNEKAARDKITVTANITATAVWENIPAGHTCDIKPVANVNPSCTEGGKEAYYKCEGCGKFFEDVLGTKEITDLAAWGNIPKNGHTASDWKSDDADHWKECTGVGCGVIIEGSKEAHTASDWITDTAATATTAGTKHKECTTCGYVMETGTIPATGSVTAPKIIKGDGAKVTHGEKTALSFRSDADFSDFIRVEIDGKTLDAKNYTVKEGSTIVTLNSDYVSTLSVGTHTIGVVSNNATATATFTVEAGQTTGDKDNPNTGAQDDVPQTGDNSMMALWIAVLFVSGFGVVATAVYGKKRKSVK